MSHVMSPFVSHGPAMPSRTAQAQKHCFLEKMARIQTNTKQHCCIVKNINLSFVVLLVRKMKTYVANLYHGLCHSDRSCSVYILSLKGSE